MPQLIESLAWPRHLSETAAVAHSVLVTKPDDPADVGTLLELLTAE
jgi:hypothetical protein